MSLSAQTKSQIESSHIAVPYRDLRSAKMRDSTSTSRAPATGVAAATRGVVPTAVVMVVAPAAAAGRSANRARRGESRTRSWLALAANGLLASRSP